MPLMLAGGLGGTLRTGRSLDHLKACDTKRKLCFLYLGLMDRMGGRAAERVRRRKGAPTIQSSGTGSERSSRRDSGRLAMA